MRIIAGTARSLPLKTIEGKDTRPTKMCIRDRPKDIRHRYGFCEYNYAMKQIHFPYDFDALVEARRRLVIDEFFLLDVYKRQLYSRCS